MNANGTHMHNRSICAHEYYMYMARHIATGAHRLRDAHYTVAVGVLTHELVVACNACAGVLWADVIKQHIAVCTYAWARQR